MKKLLAYLLVSCLLLTCVGCKDDTPKPEPKDVSITVWMPQSDQEKENNWLENMENRFQAAHPEYRITWDNAVKEVDELALDLQTGAAVTADVYYYDSNDMPNLVYKKLLASLGGEYLEQAKNDNEAVHINLISSDVGGVYGFPMESDTPIMFYDKAVFDEGDVASLDRMAEVGRVDMPFRNGLSAGCIFIGCGGRVYGNTGDAKMGIMFTERFGGYIAAKKMVELIQNPNVTGTDLGSFGLLNGTADAVFTMVSDYQKLKKALGDRLGAAMLPTFTAEGNEYQMKSLAYCKCVGVNPKADEEEGKMELCMEFAAFLASAEGQLLRYEMVGTVPINKGLRQHEKVLADSVVTALMDTAACAAVPATKALAYTAYYGAIASFGNNVSIGAVTLDNYKFIVDELNTSFSRPFG